MTSYLNNRYDSMFESLKLKNKIAFVPFWMLGDGDISHIEKLILGGADALELGLPFSDPVADGPVIQKAAMRALKSGATVESCLNLVRQIRARYPKLPIGLLTYANLAISKGLDNFYLNCQKAGVDSVLLADVPTIEAQIFCDSANRHHICPVLIAPPNATETQINQIAELSQGYIYMVTRAGVTGADKNLDLSSKELIRKFYEKNSAPVMLGFGISKPEHVRQAKLEGALGAISGSAVVSLGQEDPDNLINFVRDMKAFS